MDIGLSSASFYPYVNTEDSIKLMKNLGFNRGEIFLNSPSEYDKDFVNKLIEIKDENDFEVKSIHSFSSFYEPYLFDAYKRRREDMFKHFKSVCNAASMLGVDSYTFHGMRKIDYKGIDKKFVIEIYNELLYIAYEAGIKLSQENVSWCMSSDYNFLKLLKENCKYPITFTLDIKQAYKAECNPYDYIEIMGKDIVNFHINDKDSNNVCLLPGRGDVKYNLIKDKLNKIGYNDIAIIEVYRDNYDKYAELIESANLLKAIFN